MWMTHLFLCCNLCCRDHEMEKMLRENPSMRRIRPDVIQGQNSETLFVVGIDRSPRSLSGMRFASWKECEHHHVSEETCIRLNHIVKIDEENRNAARNCGADTPIGPQSDDPEQRFFQPK